MYIQFIKKLTIVVCTILILTAYIPISGEVGDTPSYKDTGYKLGSAVFTPSGDTLTVHADDGSVSFTDSILNISGSISVNIPDAEMLESLRNIYHDESSTDKEMVNKLADYRISLLDTVSESIRIAHLYGYSEDGSDSVMKIIAEKDETLYGLKAGSVIFNALKSDKTGTKEFTCIQLEVSDPEGNADYSFSFNLEKGCLNDSTVRFINGIVNTFSIRNLEYPEQNLLILSDANAVQQANAGIYAGVGNVDKVSGFSNPDFGYSISLPVSLVPYRSSIMSGMLDYRSWELDTSHIISITSEVLPIPQNTNSNDLGNTSGENSLQSTGPEIEKISDKEYEIHCTRNEKNGTDVFRQAYITANNGFKYTIALESKGQITSEDTEFMEKILQTFTYIDNTRASGISKDKVESFINKEEGYAFEYPLGWRVEEDKESSVYYEAFSVKIPEISGAIDIDISEGEPASGMTTREAADALLSLGELTPGTFTKYSAPYSGKTVRLLSSSLTEEEGSTVVERQLSYMDENGEGRMCYVRDILTGLKTVTLFITAADYTNIDGKIISTEIDDSLNMIINSFRFISTPEYKARLRASENRCRKIVFLEGFLRKAIGSGKISSVTNTDSSREVLVEAGTGPNKGFYTVHLDSSESKAEIVTKLLRSDIRKSNKAYLDGILSFNPTYTYPIFENVFMYKRNGAVSYRSCFYIAGNGLSAYIAMEYRPGMKENEILEWVSPVSLLSQVEKLYTDSGYSVINCEADKNNPFTLNVFLFSEKEGTISQETKKVVFNPETSAFEVK